MFQAGKPRYLFIFDHMKRSVSQGNTWIHTHFHSHSGVVCCLFQRSDPHLRAEKLMQISRHQVSLNKQQCSNAKCLLRQQMTSNGHTEPKEQHGGS